MSYDTFISHSHRNKEWVRGLYGALARHSYNGRNLRPWLDERVLDPGDLSSNRELTSALDECRFLVVVTTPESMGSAFVQQEVSYFLDRHGPENVLVIQHQPCTLFDALATCTVLDWPGEVDDQTPFRAVVDFLCPKPDYIERVDRRMVRKLWMSAQYSQPEGMDPTPTRENSELLAKLLENDISDLDQEGPALVGFDRVAELLVDIDGAMYYGSKMVVGEFLALAILRDHRYRQVLTRFMELESQTREQPSFLVQRNRGLSPGRYGFANTNLLFAVSRAASKLAEIDSRLIDLSTLWSILRDLDSRAEAKRDEKVLAIMVGRSLGKLRSTDLIDLMLHMLVRSGGWACHQAVETAILADYEDSDPVVYYTDELETRIPRQPREAVRPPRKSIAGLVSDEKVVPIDESHALWPELEPGPSVSDLSNGPLVGVVRRVGLDNMEEMASRLGPTDLACLVEARVVDSLLTRAGGFLIVEQNSQSPLAQRLRNRQSRFAMIPKEDMKLLRDGDKVAIIERGAGRSLKVSSASNA